MGITKKQLRQELKKYLYTELTNEEYLQKRLCDTYSVFGKEIHIRSGKDITFVLNFKGAKTINDYFGYSAICADGYELLTDLTECYKLFKDFNDCKLTEEQIIDYIK